MGWEVGFDPNWQRDIGYGVPATCDHPGCGTDIDRGLGYVCGGGTGEHGCGLYFCSKHRGADDLCERCVAGEEPFEPTPDTGAWNHHKATHESWAKWRAQQLRARSRNA
jgi:hypothetical protein